MHLKILDWRKQTAEKMKFISGALATLGMLFYVLARIPILVIMFTGLRSLPPAAHETVYWTTLIPHVST